MHKRWVTILFTVLLFYFITPKSLFPLNVTPQIENDEWNFEIKYVKSKNLEVREQPTNNSTITANLFFLDKVLVIVDLNDHFTFGWSRLIYPVKGYVKSENLVTTDLNKIYDPQLYQIVAEQNRYSYWEPVISYCEMEYSFVKEQPNYSSETIGLVKEDEKILFITKKDEGPKVWLNVLYPIEGYVVASEYSLSEGEVILNLGFSFGALNLPYEKNMTNYKNPIGGIIEFTKTNWDLAFRIGYNNGKTHLNTYILKTQLLYLQMRLTLFKLFDRNLKIYASAGGSYWFSSFQNTKYPTLYEYYPEDKDEDYGYNVGGGMFCTLGAFFIDIQYLFFGSRIGEFGKEPRPGEFTNLYKVYPGLNIINVSLGYSIGF